MDFFHLETFLAVVQTGSFSAAAKVVHRTQPAVSQIIRKLEEEIGEALFDRSSRDGTVTDAGRLLHEYAQKTCGAKRGRRWKSCASFREERWSLAPMNLPRSTCCRCWKSSGDFAP